MDVIFCVVIFQAQVNICKLLYKWLISEICENIYGLTTWIFIVIWIVAHF